MQAGSWLSSSNSSRLVDKGTHTHTLLLRSSTLLSLPLSFLSFFFLIFVLACCPSSPSLSSYHVWVQSGSVKFLLYVIIIMFL